MCNNLSCFSDVDNHGARYFSVDAAMLALEQIPNLDRYIVEDLSKRGFTAPPVREELGRGSYGNVYKVINSSTGQFHALKVMVKRELQYNPNQGPHLANRVKHALVNGLQRAYYQDPKTSAISLEPKKDDLYVALVLPYIEGDNLSNQWELVQEKPKLMLQIVRNLALILKECYQAGIQHDDIQGGNVMLTPELEPILIDFDQSFSTDQKSANPEGLDLSDQESIDSEDLDLTDQGSVDLEEKLDLHALESLVQRMITNTHPRSPFTDYSKSRFKPEHIERIVEGFKIGAELELQSQEDVCAEFDRFITFAEQCIVDVVNLIKDEDNEAAAV